MKEKKSSFLQKWWHLIYPKNIENDIDLQSIEFLTDMLSVFKTLKRQDLVKKTAIMLSEEAQRIAHENN